MRPLLVIALAALAGCATAAQGQVASIKSNVAPAMPEMKACVGAAHANPADASITVHFPANPTQASILQLTDKSMFSPGDVQTLSHLHNDVPAW